MHASPSALSDAVKQFPNTPMAICYASHFSLCTYAVVLDACPNTATVKQGTTLVLVCRVVGVPSTTVLSYQWTCPGGSCDAGAVDPEWAAKVQQGNILVVNVRRHDDGGGYNCTVFNSSQEVGADTISIYHHCLCESRPDMLSKCIWWPVSIHWSVPQGWR